MTIIFLIFAGVLLLLWGLYGWAKLVQAFLGQGQNAFVVFLLGIVLTVYAMFASLYQ